MNFDDYDPPDPKDQEAERQEAIFVCQLALITMLVFADALAAIILHPEWFGG